MLCCINSFASWLLELSCRAKKTSTWIIINNHMGGKRYPMSCIKRLVLLQCIRKTDICMYEQESLLFSLFSFYIPPHKNWRGIMLYPPKILSVRPSVGASFPDSNWSRFWQICCKLCLDIDIGEEWFGIENGLNSFINNRVMALDWCKTVVSWL